MIGSWTPSREDLSSMTLAVGMGSICWQKMRFSRLFLSHANILNYSVHRLEQIAVWDCVRSQLERELTCSEQISWVRSLSLNYRSLPLFFRCSSATSSRCCHLHRSSSSPEHSREKSRGSQAVGRQNTSGESGLRCLPGVSAVRGWSSLYHCVEHGSREQ